VHARLQHDNDVITSAFRLGNSGLDSELKQGHRCVHEHAYEETVKRVMKQNKTQPKSKKITLSSALSILGAVVSLSAFVVTLISINGPDISFVDEENNLKTDCIRNDQGQCKLWTGSKYYHFRVSMKLKNSSIVSGYIDKVSLYPCFPKLYPLDYDVYRINRVEIPPFGEEEFSFLLAIAVPDYGNCFGVDLRDNRGMNVPAIDKIRIGSSS